MWMRVKIKRTPTNIEQNFRLRLSNQRTANGKISYRFTVEAATASLEIFRFFYGFDLSLAEHFYLRTFIFCSNDFKINHIQHSTDYNPFEFLIFFCNAIQFFLEFGWCSKIHLFLNESGLISKSVLPSWKKNNDKSFWYSFVSVCHSNWK